MSSSASDPYAWSFEAHRRRQVRRGLELSAADRLRWLETAKVELAALTGRAAARSSADSNDAPS